MAAACGMTCCSLLAQYSPPAAETKLPPVLRQGPVGLCQGGAEPAQRRPGLFSLLLWGRFPSGQEEPRQGGAGRRPARHGFPYACSWLPDSGFPKSPRHSPRVPAAGRGEERGVASCGGVCRGRARRSVSAAAPLWGTLSRRLCPRSVAADSFRWSRWSLVGLGGCPLVNRGPCSSLHCLSRCCVTRWGGAGSGCATFLDVLLSVPDML